MKDLTSKGYQLLLAHLDENPAIAEEKYIKLHYRIVNYLIRNTQPNRNADRELLADKALESLAKKLEKGEVIEKSIFRLTEEIAMGLWLNYNRKHFKNKKWIEVEADHKITDQNENAEEELLEKELEKANKKLMNQRIACGRSCLSEVCGDKDEMNSFLEYFEDIKTFLRLPERINTFLGLSGRDGTKSKERKEKIAESLNISYNTLKTKMCRFRSKWEKCIKDCVGKTETL